MRKGTLAGLSVLMAYAIILGLRYAGVSISFLLSPLVAGLVLAPALMLPLAALNKHLLAWRKAHGRDVEEEEKYEHDGVISLRPRE
jgi:hypothetical protein